MTLRLSMAAVAGLAALAAAGAASAQDIAAAPKPGDVAVRVGVAGVLFDSGGKFTLAGTPVPGADLRLTDTMTVAIEGAYYLTPELSLSLTVGVPPTTTAKGRGILAPVGRLGAVNFGPAVGLVKYQYNGFGRFQPYVGAGATYMVIFKNKDGAIQNVDVDDHWGGAVQAGADFKVAETWGVYASASKLFLHSNGVGTFTGIPIGARIKMDPTVVQAGLSFRF